MLDEESRLLARFQTCELSHQEWSHRAHLLVAASYLAGMAPPAALLRLRTEIQNLNLAHGVRTTRERGYHETLTRVWLALILMERDRQGANATVLGIVEALGCDKSAALLYYSKDRLMSWQARTCWVPPDLQPLAYDPGEWAEGTPLLFTLAEQP